MISPKTKKELRIMERGGARLGSILVRLLDEANPGTSLVSIEKLAHRLITQSHGTPSFQTVKGYTWTTCLCVNDVIVHGPPTEYRLQEGDVLTIDVGMVYRGFHTDTAWTKIIKSTQSTVNKKNKKFLEIGEETLWKAIDMARPGNRVGHISRTIEENIKPHGYSIIRTLVGHGIGKKLHEDPQIPGMVIKSIKNTTPLVSGMTIAIEVIYAMGSGGVVYDTGDGWSVKTRDGALSAVFEHTVAVTDGEPVILTLRGE